MSEIARVNDRVNERIVTGDVQLSLAATDGSVSQRIGFDSMRITKIYLMGCCKAA